MLFSNHFLRLPKLIHFSSPNFSVQNGNDYLQICLAIVIATLSDFQSVFTLILWIMPLVLLRVQ